MIPYILVGVAGMWAASRSKPTSTVKKRVCLGPRSGQEYEVDDFSQAGVVIVHSPYAIATFERLPERPGFKYLRGSGNREALAWMIRDFAAPG
jgi:hypothetical protein